MIKALPLIALVLFLFSCDKSSFEHVDHSPAKYKRLSKSEKKQAFDTLGSLGRIASALYYSQTPLNVSTRARSQAPPVKKLMSLVNPQCNYQRTQQSEKTTAKFELEIGSADCPVQFASLSHLSVSTNDSLTKITGDIQFNYQAIKPAVVQLEEVTAFEQSGHFTVNRQTGTDGERIQVSSQLNGDLSSKTLGVLPISLRLSGEIHVEDKEPEGNLLVEFSLQQPGVKSVIEARLELQPGRKSSVSYRLNGEAINQSELKQQVPVEIVTAIIPRQIFVSFCDECGIFSQGKGF